MGGNRQGPLQRNGLGLSPHHGHESLTIGHHLPPAATNTAIAPIRGQSIIFGQSINDLDPLALNGAHSSASQPQHQRPVPSLVARAFL